MAKLEIFTWPNPILKKKSVPVTTVNADLKKLADDMLETMYSSNGVGLAAPQIGRHVRLIVIDTRPRDDDDEIVEDEMTELERAVHFPLVMFNPIVKKKVEKTVFNEGCLSVPGYTEDVERARVIDMEYLDRSGHTRSLKTDGLLAICIQHEIDHLEGKLFIDRLSTVKSELLRAKIRKHGYPKKNSDHHGEL